MKQLDDLRWQRGRSLSSTPTPGTEHRRPHTRANTHGVQGHHKIGACRQARTGAHADLGLSGVSPPPDDVHVGGCVGPSRGREMVEDDALARGCTGCSSQRQRAPRRLRRGERIRRGLMVNGRTCSVHTLSPQGNSWEPPTLVSLSWTESSLPAKTTARRAPSGVPKVHAGQWSGAKRCWCSTGGALSRPATPPPRRGRPGCCCWSSVEAVPLAPPARWN